MMTLPPANPNSRRAETVWWRILLAATAINCAFQIVWFWRFRADNITADGVDYIGLARHLLDGDFLASVHWYRSPLVSWMIAAFGLFAKNLTLVGRVVTILSFLLCLPALYRLSCDLWQSRVAGALAVFWFSMARGVAAGAIGEILADFLLTLFVLLYSMVLLWALRRNRPVSWTLLGLFHALAFLTKAIALPWLFLATVPAVIVRNAKSPRRMAASLLLAGLIPAATWFGWGMTMRARYGAFSTGYQLRTNLMINWHRWTASQPDADSAALDTASAYDDYMVTQIPRSNLQSFSFANPGLLRMILSSEVQNVPQAFKETAILLGPGGVLALAVVLVLLIRNRSQYQPEIVFAAVTLFSASGLIIAYCMLVFDGRYVIPIVTQLMAIAVPALLPSQWTKAPALPSGLQKAALTLFIAGIVFFASYWASPFRTVDRDFEASVYQAAAALHQLQTHGTLVSIGNGPYPEHGVGFEAALYTACLAEWRLVAQNSQLPPESETDPLARQVLATKANAVLVWGSPASPAYLHMVDEISHAQGSSAPTKLSDPHLGEVATLIWRSGA